MAGALVDRLDRLMGIALHTPPATCSSTSTPIFWQSLGRRSPPSRPGPCKTGPDGLDGLTGAREKTKTNSCMTDGLSTIVDSSSRNFLVIWRGLAPLTPAHRLMTLNPPPEIVTYHLDKLCAPTISTEYCCLVVSPWLVGLALLGCSKLPDQTSERQAAMSPKHPDIHPASR